MNLIINFAISDKVKMKNSRHFELIGIIVATCRASCLIESETVVGVEQGDYFSNKDEILALGNVGDYKHHSFKTCEDDDEEVIGI